MTLDITQYTFVQDRRNKTKLYRSNDNLSYLRIGPKDTIKEEYNLQTTLLTYGIIVPKIIEYEEAGDTAYFIEESLGEPYMFHMTDEVQRLGGVSTNTFATYAAFASNHLKHQKNIGDIGQEKDYISELLKEGFLDEAWYTQVVNKMQNELATLPKVRNHGDFTPPNIFTKGLIDFEDASKTYRGYDAIGGLTHLLRFPNEDGYERKTKIAIRGEQFTYYIEQLKKETQTDIRSQDGILGGLVLYRGIFACLRMHNHPLLQKYRYELFQKIGNAYLANQDMYTFITELFEKQYSLMSSTKDQ